MLLYIVTTTQFSCTTSKSSTAQADIAQDKKIYVESAYYSKVEEKVMSTVAHMSVKKMEYTNDAGYLKFYFTITNANAQAISTLHQQLLAIPGVFNVSIR